MSPPSETAGSVRHSWFGRLVPERKAEAALLGALVPAGWLLHDFVVFTTRGEPSVCLDLLPGAAVAVAIGLVTGLALGLRPVLLAPLLVLSLAGSLAPSVVDPAVSRAHIWLPRAVFLGSVTFAAAAYVQRQWSPGLVRLGLTGGFLACLAKSVFRFGMSLQSRPLLLFGLLVLALGFLRHPWVRRLATLACIAVPLFGPSLPVPGFRPLVETASRRARATRPDLPPPAVPAQDGPNLLLIVLDTVRADRLAPYGYERVTTPGLDAFVEEHATIYTESRSTSPFTLSSHASLFTGLYPAEHGATHPSPSLTPLRDDVPTLAERLRDAGYQTAAIVANTGYLNPTFRLDRGYEHFDDRAGCNVLDYLALPQYAGATPPTGHLPYRDADSITDAAIRWLDEGRRPGPFFLTLNYLDAHTPYLPPAPFDRAFDERRPVDPLSIEGDIRPLLYDRGLLHLDSGLTRFLRAVEERGLFDDTVIVVTSDHGESLGDHGILEHCWHLYDGLVKVPLYVKPVGRDPEPTVSTPVTSADVFHLALRELGFDTEPHDPLTGTPGEPELELIGEWHPSLPLIQVYAEWDILTHEEMERDLIAWMEGRTKYIVSAQGGVEAYDLDEDPGELHPLELGPEEVEAALDRAKAWWAENPLREAPQDEMDAGTRARMEALGYGGR